MAQDGQLSPADAKSLAEAKGKTATIITTAGLLQKIDSNKSNLLIVSFWKKDCQPCIQMHRNLQTLQLKAGAGKLKIFSVNLDPPNETEAVNLALRTEGITAEVFQLEKTEGTAWAKNFSPNWNGQLPALYLKTSSGLQQFYQQDFSENELLAILQPLIMSE